MALLKAFTKQIAAFPNLQAFHRGGTVAAAVAASSEEAVAVRRSGGKEVRAAVKRSRSANR